jgi:hypothetical protein
MTENERLDDRTRRRTIEMNKLIANGVQIPIAICRAIERVERRAWVRIKRAADRRAGIVD